MPTKKPKFDADALTKAWEAKLREAFQQQPPVIKKPPKLALAKAEMIDWFGEG